jgi:predicted nucleic acid-binding protein
MIVLLDTGPLGRLTSPKGTPINTLYLNWLKSLIANGVTVLVPEICDYELRRELLRSDSKEAIKRLDQLRMAIGFLPLDSSMMLTAAGLWAHARRSGFPTAHDKALDGDVILAAQAQAVGGVIATENVGHLSRFVDARVWKDVTP